MNKVIVWLCLIALLFLSARLSKAEDQFFRIVGTVFFIGDIIFIVLVLFYKLIGV